MLDLEPSEVSRIAFGYAGDRGATGSLLVALGKGDDGRRKP